MPKLKAHCTLIIKMIIFVQCSVVLFPRQLCSKRVETSGGKIVELDKVLMAERPKCLLRWGFHVCDIFCPVL